MTAAPTRPPRRGPAPPPADLERALLLDAGLALLTEQGPAALTISNVLDREGLSTRAFYRHFPSRDEFILAIWLRETDDTVQRLRERTEHAPTGLAGVTAWIDDRLERVFGPVHDLAFTALWRHGFWLRNVYPEEFEAVSRPQITALADAIARGLRDGTVTAADPILDAATIHAAFWMLAERHINRGEVTRSAAARQLGRIVHGLLGHHPT